MSSFKKWFGKWIKHGTERHVVLLPCYVLKFAIWPPKLVDWVLDLIKILIKRKFSELNTLVLKADIKYFYRLSKKAITSNKTELHLSKTMLASFVAPTVFSFFGLINVAKRAKQTKPYPDKLTKYATKVRKQLLGLAESLGEDFITSDLKHTLGSRENFAYINDRVVLVDYGSPALRRLFEARPTEVIQIFLNARDDT